MSCLIGRLLLSKACRSVLEPEACARQKLLDQPNRLSSAPNCKEYYIVVNLDFDTADPVALEPDDFDCKGVTGHFSISRDGRVTTETAQ